MLTLCSENTQLIWCVRHRGLNKHVIDAQSWINHHVDWVAESRNSPPSAASRPARGFSGITSVHGPQFLMKCNGGHRCWCEDHGAQRFGCRTGWVSDLRSRQRDHGFTLGPARLHCNDSGQVVCQAHHRHGGSVPPLFGVGDEPPTLQVHLELACPLPLFRPQLRHCRSPSSVLIW